MGGQLKAAPEDFMVEELPAYLPSGEGEHLFLWIEKRGTSTPEVVSALATALQVPQREIGYAGLKDRQAVARQWISVPAIAEPRLPLIAIPGVSVLEHRRHRNKLRTGHLKANRFRIRIRHPLDLEAARAAVECLRTEGLPNYYGAQRFGRGRQNPELGKALLQGQRLPRIDRFRRKLFLSAYQSSLFNRALDRRIRAGAFSAALEGDVMQRLDSGGLFLCEDPASEQPRLAAFEISPAGPLFGPKMIAARGRPAEAEAQLLVEEGLALAQFKAGGGETQGGRRPYRLPVPTCQIESEGADAWLMFELPKGSYATALLREVLGPRGVPAAALEVL
jgi:tRNA pseudouridine13 synthase